MVEIRSKFILPKKVPKVVWFVYLYVCVCAHVHGAHACVCVCLSRCELFNDPKMSWLVAPG